MPNTWSRCFDKNGNGQIDPHGECHGDYELEFALPQELARGHAVRLGQRQLEPDGSHAAGTAGLGGAALWTSTSTSMPREAVRQIRPGPCAELIHCDDFVRAQMPVPAQYVHADHIDVGAAVNDMGNHLIDSKSPELAPGGPPFTHTFIFGAYDGQITFYEPMITLAYLESRPDTCVPIKQPQAWATEGHYPDHLLHPLSGRRADVHRLARGFRASNCGVDARRRKSSPVEKQRSFGFVFPIFCSAVARPRVRGPVWHTSQIARGRAGLPVIIGLPFRNCRPRLGGRRSIARYRNVFHSRQPSRAVPRSFSPRRQGLVNLNALARGDVRCWESVRAAQGSAPAGRAGRICRRQSRTGGGDAAGLREVAADARRAHGDPHAGASSPERTITPAATQ